MDEVPNTFCVFEAGASADGAFPCDRRGIDDDCGKVSTPPEDGGRPVPCAAVMDVVEGYAVLGRGRVAGRAGA